MDTTCSDLQWTVAAKHRGVPLGGDAGGSLRHLKGHHLRVDCGVPRAHEHIRRVLDGRASAAWRRCGLRPSGDAASHPCDAPRRRRRRCSPSLVQKSLTRNAASAKDIAAESWPFACATDGHRFGQPSSLSQSVSVCLLVGTLKRWD